MPMQQRRSPRLLPLLTGLLFAGLTLVGSAQGQSVPKDAPALLSNSKVAPAESYSYVYLDPLEGNQHAPKADDGQHQGLQLHGHWIIDVKNPDGTIAQHRDFENSLQGPGAAYLIGLMAGYVVPSDYAVYLGSTTNQTSPCQPPTAVAPSCVLVHSLTTTPAVGLCTSYFCVNNLSYSPVISYSNSSLTLSGSLTASRAGDINFVATYAGSCPNGVSNGDTLTSRSTIAPATCNATNTTSTAYYQVTQAGITPVSVVASQIVQVTVVITIS